MALTEPRSLLMAQQSVASRSTVSVECKEGKSDMMTSNKAILC